MNKKNITYTSEPFYVTSEKPLKLNELFNYLNTYFNFKEGEPLLPGGKRN